MLKTHVALEHIRNLAAETTPLMRFNPEMDIEQWRTSAKHKLTELLGLPLPTCEDLFCVTRDEEGTDFQTIEFEFQSEPGYLLSATLLIPNGLSEPAPTAICLQGHSSGKHISLGVAKFPDDEETIAGGRDFAVRAVREGYCAVAIDQRYMGESGQNGNGDPSCGVANTAMAALLLGRTAIGERVWDIMRLIDIMQQYFRAYVDPNRLVCMGNSGGGTSAFYASCLNERIALAMPSCAFCTYDASIIDLHHCSCNYIPGIRKYFNMGDLGCLIAPRRLVMVAGMHDTIFPMAQAEASFEIIQSCYRALGKEEMCHFVKGNGGHQFYPGDAWPIVHKLLD